MTNNTQGAEIFLPAPNYDQINGQIEAMLNPSQTVRFGDTGPRSETRDIGQRGVKLFVIEQARDGFAPVFDLTRRAHYEDFRI